MVKVVLPSAVEPKKLCSVPDKTELLTFSIPHIFFDIFNCKHWVWNSDQIEIGRIKSEAKLKLKLIVSL